VGNPERAELTGLDPPESRSAFRESRLRILVLGGSQGARFLNEELPAVFARLERDAIEIWHQCGALDHARTVETYRGCGVSARVDAFLDDMRAAFQWAQLAISRGGALTVAELAAVGLGAVIVPFPHAVDDHQARNAALLVEHRAAVLVRQGPSAGAEIESALRHLLGARAEVVAMACRARSLAQPDAARRVAEICLEVAHA
jgi:UDP-N-acetylglucosamine--N-acetylmuramyl-(pentapeptide) pyrophosphoryl-undecaprenol N-acetylglucosamine transferase